MEIRVISLSNQHQRREKMAAMLKEQALPWKFFDAIPGNSIDKYRFLYDRKKRMRYPGHELTDNEIACFISHRSVWLECVESNTNFLIFEDDAYGITNGFGICDLQNLLLNIEYFLSDDILVRLGHGAYRKEFKKIKKINDNFSLVRYKKDPLCALAYVLTPNCAKKLIENSRSFYLPVDDFMWNGNESQCRVLDIDPVFFYTPIEGNPSTIGGRVKPKQKIIKKLKREFWRIFYRSKLNIFENKTYTNISENECIKSKK